MRDFKKVKERKDKMMANDQMLHQMHELGKKNIEKQVKDNFDHEVLLNEQFDKDETLICAFPRIHVPTFSSLKKVKYEK